MVTLFLSVSAVLLQFPKKDLYYGATSLRETVSTIVDASLYELNPYLMHPPLHQALSHLTPFLLPLLGILGVCQLVALFLHRAALRDVHSKWLTRLGCVLAGVVILTISAHWLSFQLFHLLLPKDRTAIYFVPLCTLVIGILTVIPLPGKRGNVARIALNAQLYVLAGFFLLCMRLGYFKEWKYDADIKNVYSVLAYYNHAYDIKDIASN